MEEERRCRLAVCNKVLIRGPTEQLCNWKPRQFCDKNCAADFREDRKKQKRKQWIGHLVEFCNGTKAD